MSEWLPIESAPKDGTNLLLAVVGADFPLVGYRLSDEDFRCSRDDDFFWPQPTHWMPLPDPPPVSATSPAD